MVRYKINNLGMTYKKWARKKTEKRNNTIAVIETGNYIVLPTKQQKTYLPHFQKKPRFPKNLMKGFHLSI